MFRRRETKRTRSQSNQNRSIGWGSDMHWYGSFGWIVGLAAVIAWPVVAVFSMWSRTRLRELEIRERIAMIEKGLVPPPEVDPGGFDRAMYRYDRYRPHSLGRHRRAGIILMGIG